MTTIRDIAEALGVSVSTVSKGLNGGKDISDALRQTILEKAVELGYVNRKAIKAENRKLCIFIENISYESSGDFGYDIVLGYRQAASKEGWAVDIVRTTPSFQNEQKYDTFMLEHGYSGSFIMGFALEDPWMDQFMNTKIPTVLLDNAVPANPYVCYVGTDNNEGIDLAIEHLLNLGHEKIAFLNGSNNSLVSDQRMSAYLASLSRHHLPIDPALAVYGYYVADAAHYHVPNLLSAGATAIICGNDLIAEGTIESLKKEGYGVPEDVSVIGFDDIPTAEHTDPPLTTVHQDRLSLGRNGYYVLHAMLNQVAQSISLLRPSITLRSSTALARPRLVTDRVIDKDSVMYVNPELYGQKFR